MTLYQLDIKETSANRDIYLNYSTSETRDVETRKGMDLELQADKNLPMYAPSKMPRIF